MAIEILRDLRGLRIEVMHPPDAEGVGLVEHLRRIGCVTTTVWPLPDEVAAGSDIVVLAVEHDSCGPLRRLFREPQPLVGPGYGPLPARLAGRRLRA